MACADRRSERKSDRRRLLHHRHPEAPGLPFRDSAPGLSVPIYQASLHHVGAGRWVALRCCWGCCCGCRRRAPSTLHPAKAPHPSGPRARADVLPCRPAAALGHCAKHGQRGHHPAPQGHGCLPARAPVSSGCVLAQAAHGAAGGAGGAPHVGRWGPSEGGGWDLGAASSSGGDGSAAPPLAHTPDPLPWPVAAADGSWLRCSAGAAARVEARPETPRARLTRTPPPRTQASPLSCARG
jgi:hypothetical protein